MHTEPKNGISLVKTVALRIASIVGAIFSFIGVMAIIFGSMVFYDRGDWLSLVILIVITSFFIWGTYYVNSLLKTPTLPVVMPTCCECCGATGPIIKISLDRHIGAIVLMFHKSIKGFLCSACIKKFFWEYTLITFIFGWWGILSMVITPIVLISNSISYMRSFRIMNSPK